MSGTAELVLVWAVVVTGTLAWLVSAVAIGVLVGKSIRRRDRQVPR